MTAIRILPDLLANKIAAGEVVERPASVVKELVENALDAGSSRILITIENGGRTLIQVADNGSGMGHDDALLCLERFATSKLHDDAGLATIATLGFRGEALPSIAAVSKMMLTTRRASDDGGVQVTLQGGKILAVQETGAPPGTVIRITQLFFNTPARRKFMKSVATEMGHIADTVAGLALGRSQVHFSLTHNARGVHQWPRTEDPAQRAAQVLGQAAAADLIPIEAHQEGVALTGYLGLPRLTRTTSRGTFVFVNGRRVRDRVVQHALFEGYRGRLMKGRFPLAVLFIQLPFDQVDVNVHPTKHEVRFADTRAIHALVQDTVAGSLGSHERRLWAATPAAVPGRDGPIPQVAEPLPAYLPDQGSVSTTPPATTAATAADATTAAPEEAGTAIVSSLIKNLPPVQKKILAPIDVHNERILRAKAPGFAINDESIQEEQLPRFADLTIIGQLSGTYIICGMLRDLILIDQHAAHERIVYEALGQGTRTIPSQRLVLPVTVELGFSEAQALTELLPELIRLGLEIEPFGGTTFSVRAVPAMLDPGRIEPIVVELAEKRVAMAAAAGSDADLAKILEQCRVVMACHKAVRANQRLTPEEIRALLVKLDACHDPGHCPHGRPTWIRWTAGQLAKTFGRTG